MEMDHLDLINRDIEDYGDFLYHDGKNVSVGEWQGTSGSAFDDTIELINMEFLILDVPITVPDLIIAVAPDLPWAEDHFQERVSRIPHNPPPSAAAWRGTSTKHTDPFLTVEEDGVKKYSHTYPERYWPKLAGDPNRGQVVEGIRYFYGDLDDVVQLLARNPHTRQAYLPVWFPEDTGAVHGQRVPCSLGYHFLIRDNRLHCNYFIRSVDYLRHFRNDVYLTCRLMQWMLDQLQKLKYEYSSISLGHMTMFMSSLHVFKGDMARMKKEFG